MLGRQKDVNVRVHLRLQQATQQTQQRPLEQHIVPNGDSMLQLLRRRSKMRMLSALVRALTSPQTSQGSLLHGSRCCTPSTSFPLSNNSVLSNIVHARLGPRRRQLLLRGIVAAPTATPTSQVSPVSLQSSTPPLCDTLLQVSPPPPLLDDSTPIRL
jgi:hypothetical protein